MIKLRLIETKLEFILCMDIAGLDKFDFHYLSRKLSNKYVSWPNPISTKEKKNQGDRLIIDIKYYYGHPLLYP